MIYKMITAVMFNKMNRSTLALILIAGLILSCYGTMKTADSPGKF